MKLNEYKNELLMNPKFKKEFESVDLSFEISEMLIDARVFKGITQAQLAKLLDTKQPSIARAENGEHLPSLSFLQKVAEALGTYLIPPKFGFLEKVKSVKTDPKNSASVNKIASVGKEGLSCLSWTKSNYNSSYSYA